MRSLLAQGACRKPTLCHQAVGLRCRGGHEGSVAVSLPMILCRTLCVCAHLAVHPGPCLSRAASVPLEPVFDSECLCMFEAYVCVSRGPAWICLPGVCCVCV